MSIQLEQFIIKAREKKAKEVKVLSIDVEGIGAVEFTRPETRYILDFMEKQAKEGRSFGEIFEDGKELLYTHCPILQRKEVREEFKVSSPYDLVTEIFGIQATSEVLQKFMEGFGLAEAEEEAVKN